MTAVREKIPVIAIVANNREWGAEKKNQIDYYNNRFIGADLRENPDYARLAQEMGAEGIRVTAPDQVGDAVREAAACGRPCVIDAMIQGGAEVLAEPFRRDALKMPVRYLEKYKHLMIP
jgi:sulfoacetaldehyde acetyltransferase